MKRLNIIIAMGSMLLGLLMLFAGCGGSQQATKDARLIWPTPPDDPRVEYVKTIRGGDDYTSALGSIASSIAGKASSNMLNRPFDVCTDGNGKVWVTDVALGVLMIDDKKREVTDIGADSPVPLTAPRGIAVAHGKVYIGLADQGQVVVHSAVDGKYITKIGHQGMFGNPIDVAFDSSTNHLVVVDNKQHRITVFNEHGDSLFAFGEWGNLDGCLNAPSSVAFDSAGNMYVVDAFNFRIEVFDANGKYLRQFGQQGSVFGSFARPKGIALDTYGNIYVLDAVDQNFQIFNNKGEFLMYVGKFSSGNDGFQNPISIAIDRSNTLYVADQLNNRVQVFKLLNGL